MYLMIEKIETPDNWMDVNFLHIGSNSKEFVDNIPLEDRSKHYKANNKLLYCNILDILMPCNYFDLCYNFLEYSTRLKKITYLYNLMNDKPSPTYSRLNITSEID
jgi:hypothetical protein